MLSHVQRSKMVGEGCTKSQEGLSTPPITCKENEIGEPEDRRHDNEYSSY